MINLPLWVLPDKFPSVYDSESFTAIEMVSKLYGAMRTFTEEYNRFAEETNKQINEFMESTEKDWDAFAVGLRQEFQDFIDTVELKLMGMDKEIDDAITYMKNNLSKSITELLQEMKEQGEFNNAVLEVFAEFNGAILGLREKVLSLTATTQGVKKTQETVAKKNSCWVHTVGDKTIKIKPGFTECTVELSVDPTNSHYLTPYMIYGFGMSTLSSFKGLSKTLQTIIIDNKVVYDNTTSKTIFDVLPLDLTFETLVWNFISENTDGSTNLTTLYLDNEKLKLIETKGTGGTLLKSLLTLSSLGDIATHGEHAKIFKAGSYEMYWSERIDDFGDTVVKTVNFKGGF